MKRRFVEPPWYGRRVIAPSGWTDDEIEWVDIASLRPTQTRWETHRKAMIAPGSAYPALRVNRRDEVVNGHHRYYTLLDAGWRGTVPVVRG